MNNDDDDKCIAWKIYRIYDDDVKCGFDGI